MNLRVDPTTSRPIPQSWYDEMPPAKKRAPVTRAVDTISSMQAVLPKKRTAGFFSELYDWFESFVTTKQEEGEESVLIDSPRPFLEQASLDDISGLETLTQEMEQFLPKAKLLEEEILAEEKTLTEQEIFRRLIDCVKVQQHSKEYAMEVQKEEVNILIKENKQLESEHRKGLRNLKSKKKIHKVLGWVNTGLEVILLGTSAVSVAVAGLLTGGAGILPVALLVGQAAAGISSGATTITQGIIKYHLGQARGDLLAIQDRQELNEEQVKVLLEELNKAFSEIENLWKNRRQITRSTYEVARVA